MPPKSSTTRPAKNMPKEKKQKTDREEARTALIADVTTAMLAAMRADPTLTGSASSTHTPKHTPKGKPSSGASGKGKGKGKGSRPPYSSKYDDDSDEAFADDSDEDSNPDYEPVKDRHPCYICQFYGTDHTGSKHPTVRKPFKGKSEIRWKSG